MQALRQRGAYMSPMFAAAAAALAAGGMSMQQESTPFSLIGTSHADKNQQALPAKPKLGALDPNDFKAFKLVEKEKLTRNTYRYRFELPNNQPAGLTVASCLVTRAVLDDGKEKKAVVRPYTPTSPPDARGYMDLVVKVYDQGKMSKHIGGLKVGDTLEMKGPIPKLPYTPNMKKHIGMVAGGTGITPMLQIIDAVLANPQDRTNITLVYANITPGDIILRQKLDKLAAENPGRLKVVYTVEKPGWFGLFWKGEKGRPTKDMLAKHLPKPDKDSLVMVCGPPGMMEAVCGNKDKFQQGELKGFLKDLGYTSSTVFKF